MDEDVLTKTLVGAGCAYFIAVLAVWAAVIFVILHFVAKLW